MKKLSLFFLLSFCVVQTTYPMLTALGSFLAAQKTASGIHRVYKFGAQLVQLVQQNPDLVAALERAGMSRVDAERLRQEAQRQNGDVALPVLENGHPNGDGVHIENGNGVVVLHDDRGDDTLDAALQAQLDQAGHRIVELEQALLDKDAALLQVSQETHGQLDELTQTANAEIARLEETIADLQAELHYKGVVTRDVVTSGTMTDETLVSDEAADTVLQAKIQQLEQQIKRQARELDGYRKEHDEVEEYLGQVQTDLQSMLEKRGVALRALHAQLEAKELEITKLQRAVEGLLPVNALEQQAILEELHITIETGKRAVETAEHGVQADAELEAWLNAPDEEELLWDRLGEDPDLQGIVDSSLA